MKKWSLAIGLLNLIISIPTYAESRIAIVNTDSLFQQIAQKDGVFVILENEFKERASELQHIENDLQSKMHRLQHDSSIMKLSDRNKLEKEVMSQRQNLSQKAQAFEQDRQRRSNEERSKLVKRIQKAMNFIAINQNIDLVIDANAVTFNGSDIKDITDDVLKQVK